MPADPTGRSSDSSEIFDQVAEDYDAWYDSPEGASIFASELDAIRPLLDGAERPWLEVGVGTGRFAAALGVEHGLDPAENALAIAIDRGVKGAVGRAEDLPFPDDQFGAVLFILSLCFIEDQRAAIAEARRVLRDDGVLVLGILPADGPWAEHYTGLARDGDPVYRFARFLDRDELFELLATTGFRVERTRVALFHSPTGPPVDEPARDGDDPAAGFLAVCARPR